MLVLAPAKINLHLRVGKRRDDGFHPLVSWMCTVGLFDKLIFQRAPSPEISLSCNRADVPTDSSNLVLKALSALHIHQGLSIHLEKQIPHGAGLGGGSSDAARTLLAINAFMKLDLGKGQLEAVAATLGSDLSFFFHEPSALCRGRGEIVEPIAPPLPRWGVLILPFIHMPTPAVYRKFDELNLGTDLETSPRPCNRWSQLTSRQLLSQLCNDLEIPAFALEPKLKLLKEEIERIASRVVRMSGSGSSLFTLYDDPREAQSASDIISRRLQVRAIPVELAPTLRDDLNENFAARQ